MKRRFLPLIPCVAILAIGCTDNSLAPSVPILAVAQPNATANSTTSAARESITDLDWAQLAFDLTDRSKFDPSHIPKGIRDLDGKLVRVRGYYYPGSVFTKHGIKEFVLFGEIKSKPINAKKLVGDPFAIPLHYLMAVQMSDGQSADFTMKPVAVVGRFSIKVLEFDGKPICVFNIVADSVVGVNPRDGYRRAIVNGC